MNTTCARTSYNIDNAAVDEDGVGIPDAGYLVTCPFCGPLHSEPVHSLQQANYWIGVHKTATTD